RNPTEPVFVCPPRNPGLDLSGGSRPSANIQRRFLMSKSFPPAQLQARKARYFELSTALAYLSHRDLQTYFQTTAFQPGWGLSQTLQVAGQPVFIKRLPLTQREYTALFSTKNLFQLPVWYNYGVGSA